MIGRGKRKEIFKIEVEYNMLSRKQTWRKIRSKTDEALFKFCDDKRDEIFLSEESDVPNNCDVNDTTSHDTNTASCTPSPIKKLRSALSMGDLSKALRRNEDSRNLRFSSKVHVCLIPTRQDLNSVSKDVFWNTDDYQAFKREAVDELRTYLQLKGITAKEAIQALYQPQPEEFSFLNVNTSEHTESGMTRSDSSPAVMEMANSSSPSASSQSATTNITESNGNDMMEINEEDCCSGNAIDEYSEDTGYSNFDSDIKLGFKTDLDMNKELGAIKTPARQGGGSSGAWAVQWQAPMPAT